MTIGSNVITLSDYGTANTLPAGYTVATRGSFDVDVLLCSVRVQAMSASGNMNAVVYADSGAVVAKGISVAVSGAGLKDIQFDSPVALTAGVVYRIGYHQSTASGGYAGSSSQVTATSTPAFCVFTEFNASGYSIGSDAFPSTAGPQAFIQGLTVIDPNAPTTNVSYFDGASWKTATQYAYDGTAWKQHTTTVF